MRPLFLSTGVRPLLYLKEFLFFLFFNQLRVLPATSTFPNTDPSNSVTYTRAGVVFKWGAAPSWHHLSHFREFFNRNFMPVVP